MRHDSTDETVTVTPDSVHAWKPSYRYKFFISHLELHTSNAVRIFLQGFKPRTNTIFATQLHH